MPPVNNRFVVAALTLGVALAVASMARAEGGLWTFDHPPSAILKDQYNFNITPAWLDHVRLASARFNDGGSGSFISDQGLLITNHHVALNCIQNLSGAGRNLVESGFLAASRADEPACPGYEVNVLNKIEDVTARVLQAVTPAMNDAAARQARKAAVARIESACQKATSERCDVITLYQGGEYHLYQYKRYTDVRLVFAPEQQIAFYGGDPDNFTYPRHDLDLCLFRAYENGRPAKPAAFLAWGTQGAQEGDLVFVSGNPGSTSRLLTTAQLISLRDHGVPDSIAALEARRGALLAYAAMGKEQERRALAQIFGIENSLKAFRGRLAALRDQAAMARQAEAEQALRRKVEADPALKASVGAAWDAIAQATLKAESKKNELRYATFKRPRLFNIAGTLVQYAAEMRKPNEQRLEEFADSNLPALMNTLYSPAPIYLDLEEKLLTAHLEAAATSLGSEHPFVKAALAGATPAEAARRAVAGTALRDVAARKALTAGGTSAITASTDTMIDLARRIDPLVRATRQWYEEEVDAAIVRASQEIAQARFKLLGKTVPPDATFTLRLNYGTIKGFPMEGSQAPAFTTFFGLYDRAAGFNNRAPWNLPQRFRERMNRLDLATPLNFVTTNDTIGGSSGSPVVDREGRFVGLVFDGNIHSLAWDYFYTDERGRTVAVDARAILEALRKLYDADAVALEILGTPAPGAAK